MVTFLKKSKLPFFFILLIINVIKGRELNKIFIIPNTHLDANWLNTFEEYKNRYTNNIHSSIFQQLKKNANATFAICEIGFFKYYYDSLNEAAKNEIKMFVEKGQIEFVNGGWVSNDEAVTFYSDIILQMKRGNEFLLKEFNVIPRVAWNLDVFGHSNGMQFLLSEMGFDYTLFTRDTELQRRKDKGELEWVWYPFYKHFNNKKAILSHSYFFHYGFHSGLCTSYTPNCDDPSVSEGTYSSVKNSVLEKAQTAMRSYKSNNFLLLIGDDFSYTNDNMWRSIDLFLRKYNQEPNNPIKIEYSTPSKYFEELHGSKLTFPSSEKDIMPLFDERVYWSGYYSSWPSIKLLLRESSKYYRSFSLIFTFISLNSNIENSIFEKVKSSIDSFEEMLSFGQHHDTITGTSLKYVIENNIMKTYASLKQFIFDTISLLKSQEKENSELTTCIIKNETLSECSSLKKLFDENAKFGLSVFNPSFEGLKLIRFKVPNGKWEILGVESDIICEDAKIPPENFKERECTLFLKDYYSSFETKNYVIQKTNFDRALQPINSTEINSLKKGNNELIMLNESSFIFFYEGNTTMIPLKLEYKYYNPYSGNKGISGLYIFTTENGETHQFSENYKQFFLYKGKIVDQFTIIFKNVVMRLRMSDVFNSSFEIETYLPKFNPGNNPVGKEVILAIKSPISNEEFWTDSNGMEMQKRIFNKKTTDSKFYISSNFYPVTTAISIKDKEKAIQMSVLTDRAQGASVVNPGIIEMLLHRVSVTSDEKGINEGNNIGRESIGDLRIKHLVLVNKFGKSKQREYERMIYEDPINFFHLSDDHLDSSSSKNFANLTSLTRNIILNISDIKMDLNIISRNEIDIMLYNSRDLLDAEGSNDYFDASDPKETNFTKAINIKELARNIFEFSVGSVPNGLTIQYEELTINRNQKYQDMLARKKKWKTLLSSGDDFPTLHDFGSDIKTFEPQRIRVFRVKYIY